MEATTTLALFVWKTIVQKGDIVMSSRIALLGFLGKTLPRVGV